MDETLFTLSIPENEPVLDYAPHSPERGALELELQQMAAGQVEIPLIIGGQEIRTGETARCVMPHDHGHVLAEYHLAGSEQIKAAMEAAAAAWQDWSKMPWPERVSVFLRAAQMLSGPWRMKINAATMLNQSKTVYQAEIDAACELIDFFRFNAHFTDRIYSEQPASAMGLWDRLEWRPLEGFVLAISPFNFTSIAANLAGAPAMMGNTVLWKPASASILSNYLVMKLLMEAGLPSGVINFVPAAGRQISDTALACNNLAGIHFTGSTATFKGLWKAVAAGMDGYRSYPRIVGETGGKDFVVAHPSADIRSLVTALVRGAFEYQGQKCSAASRAYIPKSLWPEVKKQLCDIVSQIPMGDPRDFKNFMGAVIDAAAYQRIGSYLDFARRSTETTILAGGGRERRVGFFVEPTVIEATNPHNKLMTEEIFGPVLTVYVYRDSAYEEVLQLCDSTSPYALTGAVFARDRKAIHRAHRRLRHAAGNFYVNDKPTGAVVGMQPFGGSRASGTNDKAGSMLNLLRWVTPRTVKETFLPPTDYRHPHMAETDEA